MGMEFIETRVWKGSANIFLARVLQAWGNNEKKVFVADSFAGLPPPEVDGVDLWSRLERAR